MREPAPEFDAESIRRDWDYASDAYTERQLQGLDYYRSEFFGPEMVRACGQVDGLEVLDLGCGSGYFSREMAKLGAKRVVGVDLSPNQIANAKRLEAQHRLGIEYLTADATEAVFSFDEASFDLVTACVSLVDMPDPGRVIQGAYRVLRDRSRLVFCNTHPVTDTNYRAWERDDDGNEICLRIAGYYDESPFRVEWKSKEFTYPFATSGNGYTLERWVRWVVDAGFVIEDLAEPYASDDAIERVPELKDTRVVPTFLIVVARKDMRIA